MSDVVVTVPKGRWRDWCEEGALPGEVSYLLYGFVVPGSPRIAKGDRVYVVSHGRLRGYAPLLGIEPGDRYGGSPYSSALVRSTGATAVTIDEEITGFRGFRYRWWSRDVEYPFPYWQTEGVPSPAMKRRRR